MVQDFVHQQYLGGHVSSYFEYLGVMFNQILTWANSKSTVTNPGSLNLTASLPLKVDRWKTRTFPKGMGRSEKIDATVAGNQKS